MDDEEETLGSQDSITSDEDSDENSYNELDTEDRDEEESSGDYETTDYETDTEDEDEDGPLSHPYNPTFSMGPFDSMQIRQNFEDIMFLLSDLQVDDVQQDLYSQYDPANPLHNQSNNFKNPLYFPTEVINNYCDALGQSFYKHLNNSFPNMFMREFTHIYYNDRFHVKFEMRDEEEPNTITAFFYLIEQTGINQTAIAANHVFKITGFISNYIETMIIIRDRINYAIGFKSISLYLVATNIDIDDYVILYKDIHTDIINDPISMNYINYTDF